MSGLLQDPDEEGRGERGREGEREVRGGEGARKGVLNRKAQYELNRHEWNFSLGTTHSTLQLLETA